MRKQLLLVLMLGLASMGADCSDGGSGGANTSSSSSFNVSVEEPGGDGEVPGDTGPSVPEPSSALVFGAGLLVAGMISRRRNR